MVKGAKPEEVECLSEDEAFMVASVYSVESVFLVMQPEPEKADFFVRSGAFCGCTGVVLVDRRKACKGKFFARRRFFATSLKGRKRCRRKRCG